MKKQTKTVLISLGALILVTTIGVAVMMSTDIGSRFQTYLKEKKEEKRLTTKEGQLAYLKEHQQEIKDFVKSQSPKVESVQIDWDETRWIDPGMFEDSESINVFGGINDIEDSGWSLLIVTKNNGTINMDKMVLIHGITIGGQEID